MKKILAILLLAAITTIISCREDFEVGDLSFPPNVISLSPADNASVPIGDFNVKAIIVDGPGSPLASATIVMKDAAGNTIFTANETLSGTKDSVFVEGTTFDAASLGEGDYTLHLEVTDVKGMTTPIDASFKIVNSIYVSKETEMYIAGEFNGWGSTPLTLVENYTWEVKEVDLAGGKFKFKNRTDWSDDDWGDADCDGTMVVTTGGGPDTDCAFSGLVNIRFNDETLKYTIVPSVVYNKNIVDLYLLGSMNNFEGTDYHFTQTANNIWELDEIRLKEGDAFKFSESPYFMGKNFGDAEADGEAEEFGPNIVMADDFVDAYYKIVFNDRTLEYTITLVRMPYPDNLYLVGGSTAAGWDPPSSIPFMKTGEGVFEIYAYLDPAGGGFKFLQVKDWAGDWGIDPNDAAKVIQEGEGNATISDAGFYRVRINYNDLSYSAVLTNWGIVGDATPGGWSADTDMTYEAPNKWTIDVTLGTGAFKFRANDDWPINLGLDTGDKLKYDGGDIASPGAGDYHIEIILDSENGYTYTITPI